MLKRKKSKNYFKSAKQFLVGGVNSPVRAFKSVGGVPLFIKEGKGDLIWDEVKRGWGFTTHSFNPFLPEYSDGFVEFRDRFQDKDQTIKYRAVCDKVKGELIETDETNPNFDNNPDNKGVLYKDAFGKGKDYCSYKLKCDIPPKWDIDEMVKGVKKLI